jgi:HTH-type transcriptional regulator/antitoxin HigA
MKTKLIKTQREYRTALRRAEELMDARPGTAEGDELELLAALIEIYEEEHFPIPPPNPIEAIRFRMEQQNLKPQDLIPFLGSRSRVSEVLNGKRPLTLTMIRRLHSGLGIPAEALLCEVSDSLIGRS